MFLATILINVTVILPSLLSATHLKRTVITLDRPRFFIFHHSSYFDTADYAPEVFV